MSAPRQIKSIERGLEARRINATLWKVYRGDSEVGRFTGAMGAFGGSDEHPVSMVRYDDNFAEVTFKAEGYMEVWDERLAERLRRDGEAVEERS